MVPDLWGNSAAFGSLAGSLSAPSILPTRCCPWPNADTLTSERPCGNRHNASAARPAAWVMRWCVRWKRCRHTGAESESGTLTPGCSTWLFIKLNNPLQPAHSAPTQRIILDIYLLKEAHVTFTFCILTCFVSFVFHAFMFSYTPWSCSMIVCTIVGSQGAWPGIISNTCSPAKTLSRG